jgi:hypothetical protein
MIRASLEEKRPRNRAATQRDWRIARWTAPAALGGALEILQRQCDCDDGAAVRGVLRRGRFTLRPRRMPPMRALCDRHGVPSYSSWAPTSYTLTVRRMAMICTEQRVAGSRCSRCRCAPHRRSGCRSDRRRRPRRRRWRGCASARCRRPGRCRPCRPCSSGCRSGCSCRRAGAPCRSRWSAGRARRIRTSRCSPHCHCR